MWKEDILVLVSIKTTSEIPPLRIYLENTCAQGRYTLFHHSPTKRYFGVFQVSQYYKQCCNKYPCPILLIYKTVISFRKQQAHVRQTPSLAPGRNHACTEPTISFLIIIALNLVGKILPLDKKKGRKKVLLLFLP